MKALFLMFCLVVATAAEAQGDAAQHLLVGETDVYYGITPAAAVGSHPASHAEASMHGGAPRSRYRYHLVVALFDRTTHQRIRDAQVIAAVREFGLGETRKDLEAMPIEGNASYGGYFNLGGPGPYRVRLEIKRPDYPGVASGQFEYRPPQ
ncbi:TPA: hypothetical protein ACU967_005936 [Burkholderia contaminans]|uniref:hypothetical protein n=1 Tax=Burkholderia cepacia complex TaxID=87882 RepID=UPI0007596A69|nr:MULTISPECIES: hypothetical protein [Burkholderia cepacia complex]KVS22044.1 hypothetical protein WK34_20600 [Burkholderia vietnamiensis]MBM6430551.1 hypothetical protein [Burkholderia contaminans]MCA7880866.1 hypothetical protein [Burkholderia contaminans]MDN8025810.1 hypothetical protein [Burkholderia contaminans]PRG04158.1 hypothetical protein C6Q17_28375 [Burkholderia contaminans]